MREISKRPARVFAMQLLYSMEITSGTPGQCLAGVIDSLQPAPEMQEYGMRVVDLVLEHREELDRLLAELSTDWDPERMAVLDRTIMRVAMVELLYCGNIPAKVAIHEAVQIANKYSTADSGGFVNGILDQFAKTRSIIH
jgi:transcription antitermination protein NusB